MPDRGRLYRLYQGRTTQGEHLLREESPLFGWS